MLEIETLLAFATAVGSVVGTITTKAGEKLVEKWVEDLYNRFMGKVEKKSPNTARAIEESAEKPLDYGATIIDVQACIIDDPELKNIIDELAVLAENIQDPIIQKEIEKAKAAVQNLNLTNFPNLEKFADKIGQVNLGGSNTQHITNF